MDTLTICKAKSKRSGMQCKNFAVKGRQVCYIHGGATPAHNPGAKTEQGRLKQKTANWQHGMRSKEAITERQAIAELIRKSKELL